jgi:hypothetical protein
MRVRLQPAVAALLVLAQLPLAVVGPVGLLGSHCQPTRHPGGLLVAATQPAKHAGRRATGGRLVGGQDLLSLLAVGGGPFELAGAVAGGLWSSWRRSRSRSVRSSVVDSRWRSGLLGVSMANLWLPARARAWASCR